MDHVSIAKFSRHRNWCVAVTFLYVSVCWLERIILIMTKQRFNNTKMT